MNGLTCAAMLGKAGCARCWSSGARTSAAVPPSTSSRRASACPTLAHRTGPLRARRRRGAATRAAARAHVRVAADQVSPRSPRTAARSRSRTDATRTADALRAWSGDDAAAWPAIHALAVAGRGLSSVPLHPHPTGPRPSRAPATCGRLMRTPARSGRCRERPVAAAAVGPDGGGGPGERGVRDRAAARCRRRRWPARRDARPVVRRQRPAAPVARGQCRRSARPGSATSTADPRPSRARSGAPPPATASRCGLAPRSCTRASSTNDRAVGVTLAVWRHVRAARWSRRRSEAHLRVAVRARASAAGVPVADQDTCGPAGRSRRSTWPFRHCRSCRARRKRCLPRRVRIAPSLDYLEQAFDHVKYGGMVARSRRSSSRAVGARSVTGTDGRSRPVGIRAVGAEYAARGDRDTSRDAFGDVWSTRSRNTRPTSRR